MKRILNSNDASVKCIPWQINQFILVICLLNIYSSLQSQSLQWAKSMGGYRSDIGRSIAVDVDGNVYTTGTFSGTADFDPGSSTYNLTAVGSSDVFISKLDLNGNFIWAKKLGGKSSDASYSIAVDALGNIYTLGTFQDTVDFDPGAGIYNLISSGISDIFISKLDNNGNFIWAKKFGGPMFDYGYAMTLDDKYNIYFTGSFQDTVDFDAGPGIHNLISNGGADIFISKLNANGDFIWAKNMGGVGNDYGSAIALDPSGNIYTTGLYLGTADFDPGIGTYNLTSAGLSDIFISKLDANGNFLWAKGIGGIYNDGGNSIAVDDQGNVYTVGSFFETVDFDPGVDSFNISAVGTADIYISKLNTDGKFIWTKSMGGVNNDNGYSIALDASGNVYTTGTFQATMDFDPGAGTYNLTSIGSADIFISKLNSDGKFVWAKNMGKSSPDIGNSILIDAGDNLYTTGDYYNTVDFNPPDSAFLTSKGESDIYVAKYNSTVTFVSENKFGSDFKIYPNPTNGNLNVLLGKELQLAEIRITNALGKEQCKITSKNTSIQNFEIKGESGLYFLTFKCGQQTITLKVFKL